MHVFLAFEKLCALFFFNLMTQTLIKLRSNESILRACHEQHTAHCIVQLRVGYWLDTKPLLI